MNVAKGTGIAVLVVAAAVGFWYALRADTSKERVADVEDSYIWLEDVYGAKQLAWVKQQNMNALSVLTADRQYRSDFDSLLAVLDATDRIPLATLDHQYAFDL